MDSYILIGVIKILKSSSDNKVMKRELENT